MYNSGDAAEQVVRISLEGTEIALKLTGSAAKNIAAMIYAVWKNRDKNKTKGHQRLSAMLKSGKELKVFTVGVCLSFRRNYRRGEEHGSAKWGNAKTVNKKYRAMQPEDNKIFTQNVRVGLDGRKHRRTLNTVVVGGSGAGKTRFFAKPNLCQANTSFTVLDPKGELLRSTGHLLSQKGYEVRVLDLLNMEKSHCYNPFVYLRDDNDVQRLVTNLFKNTTPKGSQSNDPFLDTAASMLLLALVFYLKYEAQT